MAAHHKFSTEIAVTIEGIEHEWPATIIYKFAPGYAGSRTEPPEAASVEIVHIKLLGANGAQVDLPDEVHERFAEDEQLIARLWLDWVDRSVAAAEDRAEAMREARLIGGDA